MLFRKYVGKEFFEAMNNFYPETISDKSLRSAIMYFAFGYWFEHRRGELSINQRVCATLEDKVHKLKNDHYVASTFIKKIKLILPEMEIHDYSFADGTTRSISKVGFPHDFRLQIDKENERARKDGSINAVHYYTGNLFFHTTVKKKVDDQNKIDVQKAIDIVPNLSSTQLKFLNYFNNLPGNSFTKTIKKNINDAIDVAKQIENPETRRINLDILLPAIIQSPKPLYAPRHKTCRLFAEGPAITYLKREVRKTLTRGWIEFDLQNAHLAIIAKDWDIPELTKFLQTKQSIWTYLGDYYPDIINIKKYLKDAIYALVYGDSKRNIIQFLSEKIGKERANLFFNVPLIKSIRNARNIQLEMLHSSTSDQFNCFNQKLDFVPTPDRFARTNERSILSQKAQAVELRLLEPILDYSEQSKFVCLIALYQFDGFSVCIKQKSRQNQHLRAIENILNNHIKSLGYETKITYEVLK